MGSKHVKHSTRFCLQRSTGFLALHVGFSKDNRTLFLRGVIYGRIAFVADDISLNLDTSSRSFTQNTDDVLVLRAKLKVLEDQILDHPLRRCSGPKKSFASCFPQREHRHDRDAREILKHTLFHPSDRDQLLAEHSYYDALTGQGATFSTTKDSNLSRIVSAPKRLPSLRWQSHILMNRHPFITSKRDIGIAEGAAPLKVNDLVCLFRSGTVPFILRRHGRYYELVGACYVHEIMDVRKQYKLLRGWKCSEFAIR